MAGYDTPRSWRGLAIPHLEVAVLFLKGHRMNMQDFQALKNELEQLNVELKRFKEELLTTRIKEMEQFVHSPARRSHTRIPPIDTLIDQ